MNRLKAWCRRHSGALVAIGLAALALLLHPTVALALDGKVNGETVPETKVMLDSIWTILAGMLVFFMQAGFALVEGGFTRAKNTINIMMKNLMDFTMGAIAFWLVGFGIMFGNGNPLFGTTGFFVTANTGELYSSLAWTSVPTLIAWFFQLVFAATAATIVSGAMAERTKFKAYIVYSVVISLVLYPTVGHWIWGGGWLGTWGMLDFAGSTVVHSVGGWFALAGAIVIGPRIGKYDAEGKPKAIPGHNLLAATLGVFILWFGWYGFNPGSTMGADVAVIGLTAVNTTLAAAAGAIAAALLSRIKFGKTDISMTLNGALAGLVAVTCACSFISPWVAALFFGFIPGLLVVCSVLFFDKIHIDDPVGAISVHGVCGSFGTVLLGLFSIDKGLFYTGSADFLIKQTVGMVSVFAFCIVTGLVLFKLIKATIGLRASEEEEIGGLDHSEHGGSCYADFQHISMR